MSNGGTPTRPTFPNYPMLSHKLLLLSLCSCLSEEPSHPLILSDLELADASLAMLDLDTTSQGKSSQLAPSSS
jgi:hypothetical protein